MKQVCEPRSSNNKIFLHLSIIHFQLYKGRDNLINSTWIIDHNLVVWIPYPLGLTWTIYIIDQDLVRNSLDLEIEKEKEASEGHPKILPNAKSSSNTELEQRKSYSITSLQFTNTKTKVHLISQQIFNL